MYISRLHSPRRTRRLVKRRRGQTRVVLEETRRRSRRERHVIERHVIDASLSSRPSPRVPLSASLSTRPSRLFPLPSLPSSIFRDASAFPRATSQLPRGADFGVVRSQRVEHRAHRVLIRLGHEHGVDGESRKLRQRLCRRRRLARATRGHPRLLEHLGVGAQRRRADGLSHHARELGVRQPRDELGERDGVAAERLTPAFVFRRRSRLGRAFTLRDERRRRRGFRRDRLFRRGRRGCRG